MTLFRITQIKNFMAKLLTTECFDSFLLVSARIATYNTFIIEGKLERDFYTKEEWEDALARPYEYSAWSEMRPLCFSFIRGKKTPVSMKFVLQLKPELAEGFLSDGSAGIPERFVKAYVLTIRYEEGRMICTTGVSLLSFLPDKTPERLWDKAFQSFLDRQGIAYETE